MDDADLVALVAARYVRSHGRGAIDLLRDEQSIAEVNGDALSAEAWSDIADIATEILLKAN